MAYLYPPIVIRFNDGKARKTDEPYAREVRNESCMLPMYRYIYECEYPRILVKSFHLKDIHISAWIAPSVKPPYGINEYGFKSEENCKICDIFFLDLHDSYSICRKCFCERTYIPIDYAFNADGFDYTGESQEAHRLFADYVVNKFNDMKYPEYVYKYLSNESI